MKFTLSWLRRFLDTQHNVAEIAHKLTMIGLEIEEVIDHRSGFELFEVAEITNITPHPDANKLNICSVQTASELLQIVCGGSNVRVGMKVVLAKMGAVIPNGNFKIKEGEIRGVKSYGMLCSAGELGLEDDESGGIIDLPASAHVGDKIHSYFGLDDPVFHINVTPNRGDALGVYGIARDLAAAGVGTLKSFEVQDLPNKPGSLDFRVESGCSTFSACEIRNLSNVASPDWLQKLLNNIGIKPISAVVDVTNYICFSYGQPMHAYDADKISGGLVVAKLDREQNFKALNEVEYSLPKSSLVIQDQQGEIQCVAGVIGANASACNEATKNIVLEAASFNAEDVAKTRRALNIHTDSAYRFERKVDPEFSEHAMALAIEMILEICGGEIAQKNTVRVDSYTPKSIMFSREALVKKSGVDIGEEEIANILTNLGCQYDNGTVKPPSWRPDITIAEDLVEEIVRINGYDNIPIIPIKSKLVSRNIPFEHKRISDIKRILAKCGYMETITWSFTHSIKAQKFTDLQEGLYLQNPISSELDYMRPSILVNLLQVAAGNLNRSHPDFSLFEVGPIFTEESHKVVNNACGIRVGRCLPTLPHDNRAWDVYDVKADLAEILEFYNLDINKCNIQTNNMPPYYHPTRSARLMLGKNLIGYFGQINPAIAKDFGIKVDIFTFELFIESLPVPKCKFGKRSEYQASPYQPVTRDFAFIVRSDLEVINLVNTIKSLDKKLIKDVSIFDIYQGENIEADKKSVALSVHIQDSKKTLTGHEIDELSQKIIHQIESLFEAKLREI